MRTETATRPRTLSFLARRGTVTAILPDEDDGRIVYTFTLPQDCDGCGTTIAPGDEFVMAKRAPGPRLPMHLDCDLEDD